MSVTRDYDQHCASEFAVLQNRVDKYFIELHTDCPYGLDYTATFYQAMFGPLTDRAMELFLAAGYRRNGNCLYAMHCRQCLACIPIRLRPRLFRPNRVQKRTMKRNRDLDISYHRVQVDHEHIELCDSFLKARYPQENNSADGYYGSFFCNSIVQSMRLDFRHQGRLVGGSIIDLGKNWLNSVYFYFDPQQSKRSLGIYNILKLVDLCLEYDIEYLYLGYYIADVASMSYKKQFRPCELLENETWALCR